MDLTTGFKIGTVRGIEIRVHWSWIFIFTLITWSLAEGFFSTQFPEWSDEQRWGWAAATSVLFFASVLFHELSHAFVAQSFGMVVPSITLFIFGGVSNIGGEMRSAGQEFRVAIAGPLASWLLAAVFIGLAFAFADANAGDVLFYLGFVNFILGAFNLLPGFPLDGGRVFRSIIWARSKDLVKATRIASAVGGGIAWVMIGLGILVVLFLGSLSGLWYVLIGLFLKSASESAYQQMVVERALEHLRATDVMRSPPDPVGEEWNVQRIVDERVLGQAERALFVQRDGQVVGLITTSDLTRVPRDEWGTTIARGAMVPSARVVTVQPDTSVLESMRLMQEHDVHQLPVIADGRLVGLLTRGDILRQLELRTMLDGVRRSGRGDRSDRRPPAEARR